eukprot:m.160683 g.160683  ORF g.160683 m.160683 type:complete len:582 (+) comp38777_c0_seq15:74-1819(+)
MSEEESPSATSGAAAAAAGAPLDKILLSADVEQDAYPFSSSVECWAMVSLRAPAYEPTERAAIDLVAVIDKSGSMSGEKIKLVKETLHFVVDQLKETDRLGLVTYDTNVYNDFPLTVMDRSGRKKAHAAIGKIHDGSSTNLCGGLERGLILIERLGANKKDVSSVLLMTDGQANQGFTQQADILRRMTPSGRHGNVPRAHHAPLPPHSQQQTGGGIIRSLRQGWNRMVGNQAPPPPPPPPPIQQQQQQQAPVYYPQQQQQQQVSVDLLQQQQQVPVQQQVELPPHLPSSQEEADEEKDEKKEKGGGVAAIVHTFGFGSDHNATLLEAISEEGGGSYYYIADNEKIPESFADCLGGLLSTVGQNVALNIASTDGAKLTKVHHRRAGATDRGTHSTVNLGDIQSEEGKDIVIQLTLPQLTEPRDEAAVVATAELSYFNAITNEMETASTDIRVRRPGEVSEECKRPNPDIDMQRNRVIAAAAMQEATKLADEEKLEAARAVIDKATDQVKDSFTKEGALSKALLADLDQSKKQLRSKSAYKGGGSNFMYMQAQSHAVQRSSATGDASYATPRKAMLKKAVQKN